MHPQDESTAVGIGVRLDAEVGDLVGGRQQSFVDDLERKVFRAVEVLGNGGGMGGHGLERPWAVEVLGAADEPDDGRWKEFHDNGIKELCNVLRYKLVRYKLVRRCGLFP